MIIVQFKRHTKRKDFFIGFMPSEKNALCESECISQLTLYPIYGEVDFYVRMFKMSLNQESHDCTFQTVKCGRTNLNLVLISCKYIRCDVANDRAGVIFRYVLYPRQGAVIRMCAEARSRRTSKNKTQISIPIDSLG